MSKGPCKDESEMRQQDLFTEEDRLFEELCTIERLRAGFRRVKKNKGSPGVDGVTIAEFESGLSEELICFDLSSGSIYLGRFIHALSTAQQLSLHCVAVGKGWINLFSFMDLTSLFRPVDSGHIPQIAMVDHADIRGLVTT